MPERDVPNISWREANLSTQVCMERMALNAL